MNDIDVTPTDATPKETTVRVNASDLSHVEGHLPDAPKSKFGDVPEKPIKNRVFILKPGFCFNPWTKWPRNMPCVCGSGAKFKYCHEGRLSHAIPGGQEAKAKIEFDKALKFISELKAKGIIYKTAPPPAPLPDGPPVVLEPPKDDGRS